MRKNMWLLLVAGAVLAVLAPVAAVVVVWGATGSFPTLRSERQDSARLGSAPPASGTLRVRTQPGKVVPARRWPDACAFLTDADITAILPDAEEIEEEKGGVSTVDIEEYAANPEWREEAYTGNGRCNWRMRLPGERTDAHTFVWLRIVAVGDPDLIEGYYDDQVLGRGAGGQTEPLGNGGSYYLSSVYDAHLTCRKGPLMFELGGSTTASFGNSRGYAFWRDRVLPEFATAVVGRIQAGT